ncbi:MAG: sulfate permease, partial [Actinobacteria bacterium]|nr:sulfate permease [Actinomycetota bacterium]
MPTNILLDLTWTRRGLKWGVPTMALGGLYIYGAIALSNAITAGAPKWLYLMVLLFTWNGWKFLWNGPKCLVLLAGVRAVEA